MNSRSRSYTGSLDRSSTSCTGRHLSNSTNRSSRAGPQSALRVERRSTSERSNRGPSSGNLRRSSSRNIGRGRSLSQPKASKISHISYDPCACGPDFYANLLGPTADETLLVGLQTFLEFCKEYPSRGADEGDVSRSRRDIDSNLEIVRSDPGVSGNYIEEEDSAGNIGKSAMVGRSLRDDMDEDDERDYAGGRQSRYSLPGVLSDTKRVSIKSDVTVGPSSLEYYNDETDNGDEQASRAEDEEVLLEEDYLAVKSSQTPRVSMSSKMFQTEEDTLNTSEESQTDNQGVTTESQTMCKSEHGSCQTPSSSSSSGNCRLRPSIMKSASKSNRSTLGDKSQHSQRSVSRRTLKSDISSKLTESCTGSCKLMVSRSRSCKLVDTGTGSSKLTDSPPGSCMFVETGTGPSRSLGSYTGSRKLVDTCTGSSKLMESCTRCHCIISDEASSSTPDSAACSCSSCKLKARQCSIPKANTSCMNKSPASGYDETTPTVVDSSPCSCSSCKMKSRQYSTIKTEITCGCDPERSSSQTTNKKRVRVYCDCYTSTSSGTGSCGCTDDMEKSLQAGDTNHPKVRYAVTKITNFYTFTTFEVMKSTKKKPKVLPKSLEGVFVLKNLSN